MLKDVITIFYAPLATVYKAANIADSLGDLQNFINDLIRTVEQVDARTLLLTFQRPCSYNTVFSRDGRSAEDGADIHRSGPEA